MRTIIIEAKTDSDDRIDIIKGDVEMELSCCSTWFDCDTLKVYEKADTPQTDCESCEHKHEMGLPCYHCPIAVDCGWGEPNE